MFDHDGYEFPLVIYFISEEESRIDVIKLHMM